MILKESHDGAFVDLVDGTLTSPHDGQCIYCSWSPLKDFANKWYIGSTTRSLSRRTKEHIFGLVGGQSSYNEIPFWKIVRSAGSMCSMVFTPINFFETTIKRLHAIEQLIIVWSKAKLNFPFARRPLMRSGGDNNLTQMIEGQRSQSSSNEGGGGEREERGGVACQKKTPSAEKKKVRRLSGNEKWIFDEFCLPALRTEEERLAHGSSYQICGQE